jgi:hypothetical protein
MRISAKGTLFDEFAYVVPESEKIVAYAEFPGPFTNSKVLSRPNGIIETATVAFVAATSSLLSAVGCNGQSSVTVSDEARPRSWSNIFWLKQYVVSAGSGNHLAVSSWAISGVACTRWRSHLFRNSLERQCPFLRARRPDGGSEAKRTNAGTSCRKYARATRGNRKDT